MGEPTIEQGQYIPGTAVGPDGEPFGPLVDSPADHDGTAAQEAGYEEVEDLDPDQSQADPAVQAEASS